MRRLAVFLLVALLAPPALAQEEADLPPIQATDLFQIRQLGDVAVSPDRRQIAYVVRQAVQDEDAPGGTSYRSQLFVKDVSGRDPARALTQDDAAQPVWHPDGTRIAFVRPVDGTPQVFTLSLYGGEAVQLTSYEHGAARPRFSPEGDRLLFQATLDQPTLRQLLVTPPTWPDERPARSPQDTLGARPDPDGSLRAVRTWLDRRADADDGPRVITRLDFHGERNLEPTPRYTHVFVQDAQPGSEARLVTRGYHSFTGAEWLPDGQAVVASADVQDDVHPDRSYARRLYRISTRPDVAEDERMEVLAELPGHTLFDPLVSPAGTHVAFLALPTPNLGYLAQTRLGVVPLDGSAAPELLTEDFDRGVRQPRWSPDGWYLYFTAASDGGFPLYRLPAFGDAPPPSAGILDTLATDTLAVIADTVAVDTTRADTSLAEPDAPRIERLTNLGEGVQAYDLTGRRVYYVRTAPENPYELYALNPETGRQQRLTDHNAAWLAERALSIPQPRQLVRQDPYLDAPLGDSLAIDYWVMPPVPFDGDREYPLLVQIHGGPMAMWGPGEASMWHELQFFAGRGYAVVFANPRGSGGYGEAFKRANRLDWGEGPTGDVLAAADSALAAFPWIDEERQFVTGGSYAGYLTAWIVGHTDRFRAAAAQRGVYDLGTFLGEGNAWRLVPEHFGGYPWEEVTLRQARAAAPDTTALADDPLLGDAATLDGIRTRLSPTDSLTAPAVAADTLLAALADTAEVVPGWQVLRNLSPLTYADDITTPLLILHADEDLRTGVIGSEMLYRYLKLLDRPVEYVRYPRAGHDLSRTGPPDLRVDRLLRLWEFFERYRD